MKKENKKPKLNFSFDKKLNISSMLRFDLPTVIKKIKHKLTWTKNY